MTNGEYNMNTFFFNLYCPGCSDAPDFGRVSAISSSLIFQGILINDFSRFGRRLTLL